MTGVRRGDRIVVTGATGFVGQVLVEHLSIEGYKVIGVSNSPRPTARIADHFFNYFNADLVARWPDVGQFEGVVHLAGMAQIGMSFAMPQKYINVNSSMVTNLFEWCLDSGWEGRALLISSGAVYKQVDHLRVTETCPLSATSPYVISKMLTESQAEYYRQRGIDVLVARPFNHIGPGQSPGFIVPDLSAKLRARRGDEVIEVGNLDNARDYTDVRDVAAAYRLLLEREHPRFPIYNVCTGTPVTGWRVLETICSALDLPLPSVSATSMRAIDPQEIAGDASRMREEFGWRPRIGFRKSIIDALKLTA